MGNEVTKDSGNGGQMEVLLKQILTRLQTPASTGLDKLAAAYVKARAKIGAVVLKNSHNPHFKSNFADLGAVLKQVEGPFAEEGLALFQTPGRIVDEKIEILGVLFHESGQQMTFTTEIPLGAKSTPQAFGSAVTYGRRYQGQSVGGLAPVDDDGETASYTPPSPPKREAKEEPAAATTDEAPKKRGPGRPPKAKPEPEPEPEPESDGIDDVGGDADTIESLTAEIGRIKKLEVMKDKSDGSLYERVKALNSDALAEVWINHRRKLESK
jgi:ERF superfamily